MSEFELFGNYIKSTRKDMGYSLREFAEKAEVSPSQLSKIERGLATPTESTVHKLAYALNVEKESLLFLAGYVDDDVKEEFLKANSEIAATSKSNKAATTLATGAVLGGVLFPGLFGVVAGITAGMLTNQFKGSVIKEEPASYTVEKPGELTDEEKEYLNRELESAYKIAMRRIVAKRGERD